MPIMCVVQLPKGKKSDQINAAIKDISDALMQDFEAQPNQVRVTIEELPRGRYIAGGVMDYEMPDFKETSN
jgi:phenylpyruvate tautomerase PptA (4-oxalocrotonate tautomerase family)